MCHPYGWVLDPKLYKEGSFWQIFLKHGMVWLELQNMVRMGTFLPKFIIKVGTKASFCN